MPGRRSILSLLAVGIDAVERGLVPDFVTRRAVRRLCDNRIRESGRQRNNLISDRRRFIESMRNSPIALVPDLANAQHYEVPAEFFELVLGTWRKYSCCYWSDATTTLNDAEELALQITCERAELVDGDEILELGCGWGSLSLWMAQHYPRSQITAVSNSQSQRQYIESTARLRGLNNLRVITADMNEFDPSLFDPGSIGASTIRTGPADFDERNHDQQDRPVRRFDRVISVEMFEHMRNYEALFERISNWLKPSGKLFIHIFCHRELLYPFETDGDVNWMGRHFFSGGIMPHAELPHAFNRDLKVTHHWEWNGIHYAKTSEAWLNRLDEHRTEALTILKRVYGPADAWRWFNRWRMFFIAVAELFGFANGNEWFVSHYLLEQSRNPDHSHDSTSS